MRFWKYEGIGNDFVVVEDRDDTMAKDPDFVRLVCDRSFGIGADGILYISDSPRADARMRVLNADGSEAEMCGNGIRCVAKHLHDSGWVSKNSMSIDTLAGVLVIGVTAVDGKAEMLDVNMGAPILDGRKVPVDHDGEFVNGVIEVDGREIVATAVSMGNPHLVTFESFSDEELEVLGPKLESHPFYPRRTNVEFVTVKDDGLDVKVYERGAAWTLACGTGACAATVAAALNGKVPYDKPVKVSLPGGDLEITVAADLGHVMMSGPARLVFTGEYLEE